jgi:hypothetical protein
MNFLVRRVHALESACGLRSQSAVWPIARPRAGFAGDNRQSSSHANVYPGARAPSGGYTRQSTPHVPLCSLRFLSTPPRTPPRPPDGRQITISSPLVRQKNGVPSLTSALIQNGTDNINVGSQILQKSRSGTNCDVMPGSFDWSQTVYPCAVGEQDSVAATSPSVCGLSMGNHLVAKLAFFPPDPPQYDGKGIAG